MTDTEKLSMVKTILSSGGDGTIPSDETLTVYITIAGQEILNWKYHLIGGVPDDVTDVPDLEAIKQVYAVIAGYTHAGAEGQDSHAENGITRHFIYGDMLQYIHENVLPYVRVGAVKKS